MEIGMYKVLVLEDEPPIRRYICRMVEKCSPHFRVIASAESGCEGLELFEAYQPQLVITDVRMPRMNGLEFIQEVINRGGYAQFLIISDYRDFEYARDSLKLGVYNYLTKPVTETQMKENLDKLYHLIEEERYSKQKNLLDSLVLGEKREEITEIFEYARFQLVLWQKGCIKNQYMQYLFDSEAEQILQEKDIVKLKQRIELRTNAEAIWTRGSEGNMVIFLLCFLEDAGRKEEMTAEMFEVERKGYYTTVLSETFCDLMTFSEHYKKCLGTMLNSTVLGKNSFTTNRIFETKQDTDAEKMREQLLNIIRLSDITQVKEELLKTFDEWERKRCSIHRIETELIEIFRVLSKKQQEAGVQVTTVQEYQQSLWEIIFYARSMGDLFGGTMDMILKAVERVERKEAAGTKGRQETHLLNIEKFVVNQLQVVNSLQDISERFQLSPTYICRLFRNYRGISFNEYLTVTKMEAAQLMLMQGKSVRDVANALGYQDAFYFSKVFKKKMGVTPSEFKQTLL